MLIAALREVEGNNPAADWVAGRAGAGDACVLQGVGEVQEAAIVGAEPQGAGVPAAPAVGDFVPLLRRAVEGDSAAAIGQHPAEDLDAGIRHRLWREGGREGVKVCVWERMQTLPWPLPGKSCWSLLNHWEMERNRSGPRTTANSIREGHGVYVPKGS